MIEPMRCTALLAAAAAALLYGASSHAASSAADINGTPVPVEPLAAGAIVVTPIAESLQ